MSTETPSKQANEPVFSTIVAPPSASGEDILRRFIREWIGSGIAVDENAAISAVFEREKDAPTVISPGIAMPHARISGLTKTLVGAVASKDGFSVSAESEKCKLAVFVLSPADAPGAYLKVASGIARLVASNPSFADEAAAKANASDLREFLARGVLQTHGPVCAKDLMVPAAETLSETDSVKDAIDRIVKTRMTQIPVVDREGTLVGVASAHAILRVCMPDYLLWMDDLSPFLNFEPFQTLLQKESRTWLSDIMDDEYASVSVDAPAIAIAEAMARHKTGVCYVVDGERLAGVVTLPRFLHNVFRD